MQDILGMEAHHVGQAMDAFLMPGAMFNFGLEHLVTSTMMEGELDASISNEWVTPQKSYDLILIKPYPSRQQHYFYIYCRLCYKIRQFKHHIIDVDDTKYQEHEKLVHILQNNTPSAWLFCLYIV